MAVINPVGYLNNVTTTTGQIDRISAIGSQMAPNGAGLTWRPGVGGYGDLLVTAGSGMSVNVAAGQAFVLGTSASFQGLYSLPNDGTFAVTITAANATLPRSDLIVARVQDSQYAGSNNLGTIEVVTGVAAATPVDPTPPASSLILARVNVAAAASSVTVTDLRQWTAAIGGIIPVSTSTQRDAIPKYDGLAVYRRDTHNLEYWDGTNSVWDNEFVSGTSGITASTGWSINSQSWVRKGNVISVNVSVTRTGAAIVVGTSGNIANNQVCTFPVGMRPLVGMPLPSGSSGRMAMFNCDIAGNVLLVSTVPNVTIAVSEGMSFGGSFGI